MNELDDIRLNRDSFSFREIIGQRNEWAPRSTVRAVTASSNVNPLDGMVRVDATAGAVTMTLETAVGCSGRIHRFKKIDASANAMIVDGAGSETLDGSANKSTTAQYDVITAISNGVNWDLLLGNVVAGASGTVTSVGFTDTNDDTQTASGGPIVGSGTLDIAAVDAGSDKLVFWDDSAGKKVYLTIGSGLTITDTTITSTGGGEPAGDVTEVQFNDGGSPEVFGADPAFTWNKTTHVMTLGDAATPATIRSPDGAASANGVALNVLSGSAITANFHGGAINITAGDGGPGSTTSGGAVNITGGAQGAGSVAGAGGGVTIMGGEGTTVGGDVVIESGVAPATTAAGNIFLRGGDMTGNASTGGDISLFGGDGNLPGIIVIESGNATNNGNGGSITITTGTGSGSGFFGGDMTIATGNGTTSGRGGNLVLRGGDSPSGTGGSVTLDPGTGGTTGSVIVTAGANGQGVNILSRTELTTIAAAATTDTTIQIPAGSVVIGVSVRVTTAIPTAATFDYGINGATTRYGTGISTAANTTYHGLDDGVGRYYAAATAIRITPNLTPAANTGRVRVTISYITITPPTS